MDILNWLYIKKQQLIKTIPDSTSDLLVLGADATFAKRGDKYKSYAMPLVDLAPALYDTGNVTQTGSITSTVTVNAHTGVITTVLATVGANSTVAEGFVVNNNVVTSSSKILLSCMYFGNTNSIPIANVVGLTNGLFVIRLGNGGSAALDQPVSIHFTIID